MFRPLSDQTWSWIYVLTGCAMVIAAHYFNIPTDIGAGIIGAGINAFTKSTTKQDTNVEHASSVTVTTGDEKKEK